MDQVRQIRFLIPPLVLIASILWGAVCDPRPLVDTIPSTLRGQDSVGWASLVAGGGVVVLALGFVLGTITFGLLRLLFLFSPARTHEVGRDELTLKRIAEKVGLCREPNQREALFLVATFDHGHLPPGVHDWTVRRWNAFNINAASALALLLSLWAGGKLGVALALAWWLPVVLLSAAFIIMAVTARLEMIRMIALHAEIRDTKQDKGSPG